MTPSRLTAQEARTQEVSGELAYRIRLEFRDLARIKGFEAARAIIAEIINLEAERKPS